MQRDNKGNEKFAAQNPVKSIYQEKQNDMYAKAYQALLQLYQPSKSASIRKIKGRQYLSNLTNLNFNGI